MPRISDLYSSRFVKAYELSRETRLPATIFSITEEVFRNEPVAKLVCKVIHENGWERDLVLNQTNAQRLAAALGDNTDEWPGTAVELWVEDINYKGETMASIQIGAAPPDMLPAPVKPPGPRELDDEIPF